VDLHQCEATKNIAAEGRNFLTAVIPNRFSQMTLFGAPEGRKAQCGGLGKTWAGSD
jgi:hypothetical protein